MSEGDRDRDSLEELRALARELGQSVERVTGQLDLEELADRVAEGGERVKALAEIAGGWLEDQGGEPDARRPARAARAAADAADRRLRRGGPHPLDVPTEEQGRALSALDSGRWKVEPDTDELIADGEGTDVSPRVGLVSELRAHDWINASGEVTFIGRAALTRWEEGAAPS